MDNQVKIIVLSSGKPLISGIEEFVPQELGDPDWKLIKPHEILEEGILQPWLQSETDQREFIIISDTVLTVVEPKKELLEKYLDIIK